MPIDFNQDDELAKAIDIFNNIGWGTRVQGILDGTLGADNPFNAAALLDTGTGSGNIPVIPDDGMLDDTLLKPATTSAAGAVRTTSTRTSATVSNGFPLVMLLSTIRPLLNIADALTIGNFRVFDFTVQQAGGTRIAFASSVLSGRRGFLVLGGSGIYEGVDRNSDITIDQSRGILVRGASSIINQFYVFGGQRLAAEGIESVGLNQAPSGHTRSRASRVLSLSSWHRGGMYFNAFGNPPKETSSASSTTHPVTDRPLGTGDLAIFILDGSQEPLNIRGRSSEGAAFAPAALSEFAFFIGL